MTTITDNALESISDIIFQNIDTVAIGTGTSAESVTDNSLDNEVYRSSESSEITFIDKDATGVYEILIVVKGGLQIPGDTEITEIGVFDDSNNVMYLRDTLSGVIVDSGHTVEFSTELSFLR